METLVKHSVMSCRYIYRADLGGFGESTEYIYGNIEQKSVFSGIQLYAEYIIFTLQNKMIIRSLELL